MASQQDSALHCHSLEEMNESYLGICPGLSMETCMTAK